MCLFRGKQSKKFGRNKMAYLFANHGNDNSYCKYCCLMPLSKPTTCMFTKKKRIDWVK